MTLSTIYLLRKDGKYADNFLLTYTCDDVKHALICVERSEAEAIAERDGSKVVKFALLEDGDEIDMIPTNLN